MKGKRLLQVITISIMSWLKVQKEVKIKREREEA